MFGMRKFGFLVGCIGYVAALSVLRPEKVLEGISSSPSHHVARRQASTGNLQSPAILRQGDSILGGHRFQLGPSEETGQGLQNRPDSSEDSSLESKDSNTRAALKPEDSGSEAPRIALRTSPIQARTRAAGVVSPASPAPPATPEPANATEATPEVTNFARSLTVAETTPLPGAPSPFDPSSELFDIGTRVIITAPPRPCPGVCEFRARNGRCFENFRCFQELFLL
ncbi:hypothetical protein C7M84_011483 [Penaeus vannamei]|uniref:Uncharacterized protein n=1 Tax=Penaeus vannamei TaxID=6689 RepID=A0A3R7Q760_PENVA|nr:uncharacterized protein LOC113813672 [Penaeus vannamei]ROT70245.1 hypothetical protein C7M84_011483 [Penaeus vannamei]